MRVDSTKQRVQTSFRIEFLQLIRGGGHEWEPHKSIASSETEESSYLYAQSQAVVTRDGERQFSLDAARLVEGLNYVGVEA